MHIRRGTEVAAQEEETDRIDDVFGHDIQEQQRAKKAQNIMHAVKGNNTLD